MVCLIIELVVSGKHKVLKFRYSTSVICSALLCVVSMKLSEQTLRPVANVRNNDP